MSASVRGSAFFRVFSMNFNGILVGAAVFLIIGVFHPLVIKAEYGWGRKSWWLFLAGGLFFMALSVFLQNDLLSILAGALAFSCFWSIHEIFMQEKRVLRGWFPENPARKEYYAEKRRKGGF